MQKRSFDCGGSRPSDVRGCGKRHRHRFNFGWLGAGAILVLALMPAALRAATLSSPAVDAYDTRIGTETFAAMYQFTGESALLETAQAITNFGSDTIKLYLGSDTSFQSGVTLGSNITNLLTLVRDEPSYRQVFDMPFRHIICWTYPLANSDEWWANGYNATGGAKDYAEIYALTHYLLTNYNNSGKTFYLGHWEGDGYLRVNNWTTNPSMTTIQGMIGWLNNRQQAVDDAKRDTVFTNVEVYNYAECNRVRDAMLNGTNNNERVINMVVPYVTNLDYLSYSSYDSQNLSAANLYTTLNYMQSMLPTNKAAVVPGERMWIGEYGWGSQSTAAQEPLIRAYIQRLMNWNYNGQCLPYILYWEMYSNYNPGGGTNFCLIDYTDTKVPAWYLHNYFINDARIAVARFQETNGRLPTDTEFASMMSPLLDQPVPAPVPLSLTNAGVTLVTNTSANVSGSLAQGIYGDPQARVWVVYGRTDGGTNSAAWELSRFAGVNTNFNPHTFTLTLNNLAPDTNYFFRFYASSGTNNAWSPVSTEFSTATVHPAEFGSSMKIFFSGYNRGETLSNFPVLVKLSTNLPGFSYGQFALPDGSDLRFTDSTGWRMIPYEIDEWNTNGTSLVWVTVPSLSTTNDFIWADWGNPALASPAMNSTNGAAWAGFDLVWHLKESGFPYADSALQSPAVSGVAPALTTGWIGHGEAFNGSSDFLDAGPANLGTAFTLSCWVNVASNANNIQSVWANGAGGYSSPGFRCFVNSYNTSDGKFFFESGDGSAGVDANTGAGVVSSNQWHLLTVTVDENGGAARLYVDGVDRTVNGSCMTDFANQSDLNLGRLTNSVYYFKGSLDEARIQQGIQSSNGVWASWATVAANSSFQSYAAVSRQSPTLSVGVANAALSLLWPGSGVGYTLYWATNLTPPVTWTAATNGPMLTNNQWLIQLPADSRDARFYRLESQ